jgi:hypothetical protein
MGKKETEALQAKAALRMAQIGIARSAASELIYNHPAYIKYLEWLSTASVGQVKLTYQNHVETEIRKRKPEGE